MTDTKLFILFCTLIFLCNNCSNDVNSPETIQIEKDFYKIGDKLEKAFQSDSQILLDTVFMAWGQNIKPFSSKEISQQSDTIQQAYKVFRAFYSPLDLDRITNGIHENYETDIRFIVIQNFIQIAILDSISKDIYSIGETIWEKNIEDFRPTPNESEFPFVYLTHEADSMIYRFLYKTDGKQKDDHSKRVDFLRNAMQLTHHHWINDYHKETMPYAFTIYFDKMLTKSLVSFRVFYQFGNAYFERTKNGWELKNSLLFGIE